MRLALASCGEAVWRKQEPGVEVGSGRNENSKRSNPSKQVFRSILAAGAVFLSPRKRYLEHIRCTEPKGSV